MLNAIRVGEGGRSTIRVGDRYTVEAGSSHYHTTVEVLTISRNEITYKAERTGTIYRETPSNFARYYLYDYFARKLN